MIIFMYNNYTFIIVLFQLVDGDVFENMGDNAEAGSIFQIHLYVEELTFYMLRYMNNYYYYISSIIFFLI